MFFSAGLRLVRYRRRGDQGGEEGEGDEEGHGTSEGRRVSP
jgi:hypothetical protein